MENVLPSNPPVLVVPGYRGSGPTHWQSLWEASNPAFRRVVQRDWDHPVLSEWIDSLHSHVASCEAAPVIVAHSLACALVAHWAATNDRRVRGALLVSPSDVDSPLHTPAEVRGFSPIPLAALSFPSTLVVSTNDPRVGLERAEFFAKSWGSRLVVVPGAGHINEQSNLGDWPQGKSLLQALLRDV